MDKHIKLTITGKVQGVWYRGSAERKARELGLCGFVKNQPNGSVFAEVEGPEKALEAFTKWCWQGPPLAEVKNVGIEEGELRGYPNFEVQR